MYKGSIGYDVSKGFNGVNIPCNPTNYGRKRDTNSIKAIVVHYTANDGDTATDNGLYFSNNANIKASAHYFVSRQSICKSVDVDYIAWHCGDRGKGKFKDKVTNANSIGIELCSHKRSDGTYYFDRQTILHAQWLIFALKYTYGIDDDMIVRHYDVTGKICPAPLIDESEWQTFKDGCINPTDDMFEFMYYTSEFGYDYSTNKYIPLIDATYKNGVWITPNCEFDIWIGNNATNDYGSYMFELYEEWKGGDYCMRRCEYKKYHYDVDIPDWAKPSYIKAQNLGIVKGADPADNDMGEDFLKTLVVLDRLGLLEKQVINEL